MTADTLLVLVSIIGGRSSTVEAVLARDSTLLLPAADVAALLETGQPATVWVTLAQLRRAWPAASFTWSPRELAVWVDDPLAVLPASRRTRAALTRQARGAAPFFAVRSGPFVSLAANDAGRSLWEGGYSWRGRVAATARQSSRGTSWALSLAPWPGLFASYAQGGREPAQAAARVAAGPVWVSGTWAAARSSLDALVAVPHLAAFASTRGAFAVTITAAPVGVQIGRTGSTTTARVTWGPVPPSPFSVPFVP